MPFYMLDSNVLSLLLHEKDRGLMLKVHKHIADCYLSALVLAELDYGAAKRPDIPKYAQKVELARRLFEAAILPFDEDAAWHTGRVRAFLEKAGMKIGPYDTMLAGQALSQGAVIVTDNVGEFVRVPGLAVENWRTPRQP
jgi:tRNA(fMet)-specific endonuclease VapC